MTDQFYKLPGQNLYARTIAPNEAQTIEVFGDRSVVVRTRVLFRASDGWQVIDHDTYQQAADAVRDQVLGVLTVER